MKAPKLGETVNFHGETCTVFCVGTVHRDHLPVPQIKLATEAGTVTLTGEEIARHLS